MPHPRFKLSNARTRQEEIVLLARASKQIEHTIRFLLPSLVEVLAGQDIDALTTQLYTAQGALNDRIDSHLRYYRKRG
jgi:hypothetical protein